MVLRRHQRSCQQYRHPVDHKISEEQYTINYQSTRKDPRLENSQGPNVDPNTVVVTVLVLPRPWIAGQYNPIAFQERIKISDEKMSSTKRWLRCTSATSLLTFTDGYFP
jgi:hypothetical protein